MLEAIARLFVLRCPDAKGPPHSPALKPRAGSGPGKSVTEWTVSMDYSSRGGTRRVKPDALPRTSAGGLRSLFMFPESHHVSQARVSSSRKAAAPGAPEARSDQS